MPGIPLVAGETACSRGADQMCRQNSCVHLSAEEKDAWDESLSIYCKPLELYNILSRRAIINPSFLPRCLQYKIQAKHKRRIQMTVSLRATVHDGSQIRSLFPLCIMLARLVSNLPTNEQEAYRFKRSCLLTSCAGEEEINRTQAKFILPEIKKLSADIKSGSLSICFISNANAGGHCLVGKIPMELLHLSWQKSPKNLGERAEMLLTVDMNPCFMKKSFLDEDNCVSFQTTHSSARVSSQQLQVIITAEEIGANERSSYDSYTYNDIPSSALASITRLRSGNVIFNYKYYNNKLQTSEVTEDFTCTFCLVKCASFKGLRYHLLSSHDFFNFEFWATEEYQAVNVFAKTDTWRYEDIADGIDPQQQTFLFRSRCLRRKKRKSRIQSMRHVHPLALASDLPEPTDKLPDRTDEFVERDASSPNAAVVSSITTLTNVDAETVQSFPGSSSAASTILQLAKKRKLSERSDPNNRTLLQKRKFFHSHRAQPMSLEQVFSDMDSEDEVDDDVADLEDLRMLDDFVDVTKDEKQMMHLWNSFHRKQRVRADGHVLWACEAFSMLHGQVLVRRPPLLWCWRLFMINLWNYGLIDARCMNNCNIIFERMQRNGSSGQ